MPRSIRKESSVSQQQPQISLILPLIDPLLAPSLSQEISLFLSKFKIRAEVIFITEKSIPDFKTESITIYNILTDTTERALLYQLGINKAQSPIIATLSQDLSVPLAEVLSLYINLEAAPDTQMILAVRGIGKKRLTGEKRKWHQVLESILAEKIKGQGLLCQDPLSPYFMIRKSAWDQIKHQIKLKGWYFTHEILKQCLANKLLIQEIPVNARADKNSQIPLLKEYIRAIFN